MIFKTRFAYVCQEPESVARVAVACAQRLLDVCHYRRFCLKGTSQALLDMLGDSLREFAGAKAGLVLRDTSSPSLPLPHANDCLFRYLAKTALNIPDTSTLECARYVKTRRFSCGSDSMQPPVLQPRNQSAFWSLVAPFRYLARLAYSVKRNQADGRFGLVTSAPQAFGSVHGSGRFGLVCALFAAHTARALVGGGGSYTRHDVCHIVTSRVLSEYCRRIDVSRCRVLNGGCDLRHVTRVVLQTIC